MIEEQRQSAVVWTRYRPLPAQAGSADLFGLEGENLFAVNAVWVESAKQTGAAAFCIALRSADIEDFPWAVNSAALVGCPMVSQATKYDWALFKTAVTVAG